mmetsp:Transcript_118679/g.331088  ORF Transcript_118679/g.331088 Transcript_118679/m.331088 type:complete len:113 (+) Transcript_118679:1273-1611(+)
MPRAWPPSERGAPRRRPVELHASQGRAASSGWLGSAGIARELLREPRFGTRPPAALYSTRQPESPHSLAIHAHDVMSSARSPGSSSGFSARRARFELFLGLLMTRRPSAVPK